MRSQIIRCNGLTILNDCYNANPLSFARALETLRKKGNVWENTKVLGSLGFVSRSVEDSKTAQAAGGGFQLGWYTQFKFSKPKEKVSIVGEKILSQTKIFFSFFSQHKHIY